MSGNLFSFFLPDATNEIAHARNSWFTRHFRIFTWTIRTPLLPEAKVIKTIIVWLHNSSSSSFAYLVLLKKKSTATTTTITDRVNSERAHSCSIKKRAHGGGDISMYTFHRDNSFFQPIKTWAHVENKKENLVGYLLSALLQCCKIKDNYVLFLWGGVWTYFNFF